MKYARQIDVNFDIDVEDILARTRVIIQHGQSKSTTKLIRRFVPKKFREKNCRCCCGLSTALLKESGRGLKM